MVDISIGGARLTGGQDLAPSRAAIRVPFVRFPLAASVIGPAGPGEVRVRFEPGGEEEGKLQAALPTLVAGARPGSRAA